jgi:hypothetical protein
MFAFNLGFGGVQGAAEVPQEIPSAYRPEMAPPPELKDAGVDNIRTQGTLIARKPSVADVSSDDLTTGPSARALDAAEFADDMRVSYAVSNAYKRRGEARARARNRQTTQALKNSGSAGQRTRRKLQGTTNRRSDSYILRNARDVLGMGTDLYR